MNDTPAMALILARAGSKGLPGKNIAPIAGKPCIAWTIEHALAATRVSLIAVSTDDRAILDLVRSRYPGIAPVVRPGDLASDSARVDDAARHAVQALVAEHPEFRRPDAAVAILYANVPVRPAGLLDAALAALPGADSVQTYEPVGKHHPWWTARLDPATGEVRPWEGDVLNHNIFRRQDLPPAFVPDGGALVVTRRALFLDVPGVAPGPHAFFGKVRRGVVSPGPVVDIDTRLDAIVADAMLRDTTVTA
jgi:N-acylneuraminate cytidylyltransferase